MSKKRPVIITINANKGGVGKTTSSINLAHGLALQTGQPCLILDFDPQRSATQHFFDDQCRFDEGVSQIILDKTRTFNEIIKPTGQKNLDIIIASEDLKNLIGHLNSQRSRESFLKKAIERSDLSKYRYLVIDNSPFESLLTDNSLACADAYTLIVSDFPGMQKLMEMKEAIEQIQEDINPDLKSLGTLLTMMDRRTSISKQIEQILRDNFESEIFSQTIKRNVKFSESPSENKTIHEMDIKGSNDYLSLSLEVIQRIEQWQ
jgi:chromosome partitioning protein